MGDASDSDEDAPKLSKTECPAKLARWLALRFGLLGLDKALRSKAFNALKDARDAFGLVKDPRELETLRRYILKFKGFETDGLQKEFSHDQMTKVHMPEVMDTEDKKTKGTELKMPSKDILPVFSKLAQTLIREQNAWVSDKKWDKKKDTAVVEIDHEHMKQFVSGLAFRRILAKLLNAHGEAARRLAEDPLLPKEDEFKNAYGTDSVIATFRRWTKSLVPAFAYFDTDPTPETILIAVSGGTLGNKTLLDLAAKLMDCKKLQELNETTIDNKGAQQLSGSPQPAPSRRMRAREASERRSGASAPSADASRLIEGKGVGYFWADLALEVVEGAIETLKEAATESKKQAAKAAAEAAENDKAADAAAAAAPQQVVLLKSGNTTTAVVVAAPSGGALATAALGGSKRKKDGEGLLARLTAKLESSPGGRYVLAALAFIAHCAKAFWGFIKWIASLFSPKADEDEQELRGALQGSVLSVYALFTASFLIIITQQRCGAENTPNSITVYNNVTRHNQTYILEGRPSEVCTFSQIMERTSPYARYVLASNFLTAIGFLGMNYVLWRREKWIIDHLDHAKWLPPNNLAGRETKVEDQDATAKLDTFTERVYPFVAPVAYALSCCCLTFCGTKTPENSTTPLTVKQRYARFMNRLEAGAGGEGGSVVPGEHLLGAAGTKLQLIAPPPPAAAGASPAKKEGGKAGAAGSSAPLLRKEELLDRAGGSADAPADKQRRLPYNENDKHSVKLVKCLQSSAGCWMDLWMGDDVQIGKTMRLGEPQNGGGWRSVGLKDVPVSVVFAQPKGRAFLVAYEGGRLELWSPALKQSEGVVLEYSTSPPPAQQLLTAGGAAGSAPASPARQQGGSRKGWTPATLPPPPSGGQQSVLLLDNGKHISVVSVGAAGVAVWKAKPDATGAVLGAAAAQQAQQAVKQLTLSDALLLDRVSSDSNANLAAVVAAAAGGDDDSAAGGDDGARMSETAKATKKGRVVNPFIAAAAEADANAQNKKNKNKDGNAQPTVYTVGMVEIGNDDSEHEGVLAVGMTNGKVELYDLRYRQLQTLSLPHETKGVTAIALSVDTLLLAAAQQEAARFYFGGGVTVIWGRDAVEQDTKSGKKFQKFRKFHVYKRGGIPTCMAFSPGSSYLATGCEDKVVRVWLTEEHSVAVDARDAEAGGEDDANEDEEKPANGGEGGGESAEAPDEAGGGDDDDEGGGLSKAEVLKLVKKADAEAEPTELGPHMGKVTCVAFSADGYRIATGDEKNATIRIFDASFDDEDDPWDTFYLSLTLNNGHKRKVKSLAFDEEGTKLVSVSEDRTLRYWDVDYTIEQGCCAPENACFALCNTADEEAPPAAPGPLDDVAACLKGAGCAVPCGGGGGEMEAPKVVKVEETKLRTARKDREAAKLFVADHTHVDKHGNRYQHPLKLGAMQDDSRPYCDADDCYTRIKKNEWCYSCTSCGDKQQHHERPYYMCLSCGDALRREAMFFPKLEERRAEKKIPRLLRIPGLLRPKDREGELTDYPEFYCMLLHYNYWACSSCIVMLAALLANAAVSCAIIFSARYYLGSAQVLAVINSTRGTASQIWHWISLSKQCLTEMKACSLFLSDPRDSNTIDSDMRWRHGAGGFNGKAFEYEQFKINEKLAKKKKDRFEEGDESDDEDVDDETREMKEMQESFLEAAADGDADTLRELLNKCDPAVVVSTDAETGEKAMGDVALLKVLLGARGDGGENAVALAAAGGHAACLRILLNPKWCFDVDDRDENGETALMEACGGTDEAKRAAYAECVEVLLEHGANPLIRNKDGDYPIHAAAIENNWQVLQVLVRHFAKNYKNWTDVIDLPGEGGMTPLFYAARFENPTCTRYLLSLGAKADGVEVSLDDETYTSAAELADEYNNNSAAANIIKDHAEAKKEEITAAELARLAAENKLPTAEAAWELCVANGEERRESDEEDGSDSGAETDAEGLSEHFIKAVMDAAKVKQKAAVRALRDADGDIVKAIVALRRKLKEAEEDDEDEDD